jgi:2-polyprenyl-3-methyl-5-hydroxy-6-metoxy-1,4-benzoquinol methylase
MTPITSVLDQRATGPELMDGPDFGPEQAADTFQLLVPVNRLFGGIRPGLSFFQRESRTWDQGQTIRILDAACGVGDASVAMVRWARRQGFHLQIDAVDQHLPTVEMARQRCQAHPEITVSCQDVLELEGEAYDYVHASQFLHHFPDEQVVPVLRHLLSLSRCKVVINDLRRAPLHYLGTWLLTLFTTSVFRHDARMSVRRGFKVEELQALLRGGGLSSFELERHFFYRVLLVLDKTQP